MDNFIEMNSDDRGNKNQSMVSTHHMSCNQSHATNFYSEHRPNKSVLLSYSHIPIPKEKPQWNQSASTWRHSSQKYTFSKDNRFKEQSLYYTDILKPQVKSTLSSKSCTFGKGEKRPISTVVLRNAQEKPGPDRYDLKSYDERPRSTSRGKSFGLGWKYYEKNYIKHRSDPYAEFHFQGKPAAKYNVREIPGDNTKKFTAYGRLKIYSQKMAQDKNWVPGPYHSVKDRHLYGSVGMNDRNFAFGERIDLSRPANSNPQAIYQIPGFCDKFRNIRHKKQRMSQSAISGR